MRVLLDTHTLIWTMDATERLGPHALAAVTDPDGQLLLSAATLWELGIKVGSGKLTLSLAYRAWMARAITDLGLTILPITLDAADVQSRLPSHHRDPFDRLMIAHAIVEQVPIVSVDDALDAYGVTRIW
ncbi:MAG: type II toxin-antitoxin system VapC family toxin [Fimbriiglobus sp.]